MTTGPKAEKVTGRFGVVASESGLLWHVAEIVTATGLYIEHDVAYGRKDQAIAAAHRWAERDSRG